MSDGNMFNLSSDSESHDNEIQQKVQEEGDQNGYQDNENIMNNNTNNVDGFLNTYENDYNQNEYEQPRYLDEQDGQDGQQNAQDGLQNGYFAQQYQPPFIPEMDQQVIQEKVLLEQNQPIDPIADNKMEPEEQVDQQQGQPQQLLQQEEVDQGQNLDNLNLNYDHLQDEPLPGQQQQPQPGPTSSQAVTAPRYFQQSQFHTLLQEQDSAGKILCPPPPHFHNFASMNSLAPPSLEIIQKNKQFFSLGKIIDFSSIYANPKDLVTQEELSTVNDLISHGKNKYDVMQELVSSIMNKTVEILKHTSKGGMQLKEYIDDLDLLVKKLAILCKITKIKLAKLQIKNIFENEKKLFERSTKQIENSLQQIVNFQNALHIPEILSNQNPI